MATTGQYSSQAPQPAVDLAAEMSIWEEIAEAMQRQRDLIISRDHAALADSNQQLQEQLFAAAACRKNSQLTAEELRRHPLAADIDAIQRRVRIQAHINSELIGDALAYADFSFQLLYPQACSPLYDQEGQLEGPHTNLAVNRSA